MRYVGKKPGFCEKQKTRFLRETKNQVSARTKNRGFCEKKNQVSARNKKPGFCEKQKKTRFLRETWFLEAIASFEARNR